MVIKTFKGNSGCTIHLMNNELGNFIRKKSPNISYNERKSDGNAHRHQENYQPNKGSKSPVPFHQTLSRSSID